MESGSLDITGSSLGQSLRALLNADDLLPGDEPSYQICKDIYLSHPLGYKMAAAPILMAQAQEREILVPAGPEEDVVEAFQDEWKKLEASRVILNLASQARVYGIASVALGVEDSDVSQPLDPAKLADERIFFNVFDPLNTSGSLVTSQDPNSPMFQKHRDIRVGGKTWHRSRVVVLMNEDPIYIAWTPSAFGYVGRSVYQRALYPLKSFIQSMITDDMVTRKAGVLVAKMRQPGSLIDGAMGFMFGVKRALLRQARTDNVLSIDIEEAVETLNMQNLDGAFGLARKDILENIAAAADMPAKLLNQETFAEGFGEGVEDAKAVARYIDRVRIWLNPVYTFMDEVTQRRAWNQEFYKTIQERYPEEYGEVEYNVAFYRWQRSFRAVWPSLLTEPPSELVNVADVKLKGMIALAQVIGPMVDPENRAETIQWLVDNVNEIENLFTSKLSIDHQKLVDYLAQQPEPGEEGELAEAERSEKPSRPFATNDANVVAAWIGAPRPALAPRSVRMARRSVS